MALSERLLKLKELNKQNFDKPKEERFLGTFQFLGTNKNGSFRYELVDVDKEPEKAFIPEISVPSMVHEYLAKNKGMSEFYISQNPAKTKTGESVILDGEVIYKIKLDNEASNGLADLFREGITSYDLTATAAYNRKLISENPLLAEVLSFKSQFGLLRNAKSGATPGMSISDLKPTDIKVD